MKGRTMKWEFGKRFVQDTSGAAFVYVAVSMFGMMGFTGLAIDVGHWYATQRTAQSAADSAAVAGAFEAMWGGDAAAIETAAKAQADLNGFAASTVTVNSPPTVGPSVAEPGAVEVIIESPTVGFFSSLFIESAVAISSRSVAAKVNGTAACMVALKNGDTALDLNSNSHVTANGCMLHVNSNSSNAIRTNSSSSVTAETISVVGDTSGSGYSPSPETGTDVLNDPLAYLQPPANAGASCDHNSTDYESDTTIYPGVYCGDHVFKNGATVTFAGGGDAVYVFKGSKFEVDSSATIRTDPGDGVTLYLASGLEFILNSGSHADMEAPITGDYPGLLIYSVSDKEMLLNSDSSSAFEGTVYVPNGKIMVNSGSSIGGNAAFSAFIANEYEINSDSTIVFNNNYAATSVPTMPTLGAQRVALFE